MSNVNEYQKYTYAMTQPAYSSLKTKLSTKMPTIAGPIKTGIMVMHPIIEKIKNFEKFSNRILRIIT